MTPIGTPLPTYEHLREVRRVLNDPGAVLPRLTGYGIEGTESESLANWQARALDKVGLLIMPPPREHLRPVVVYEYLCAHCGEVLREPEWDSPRACRMAEDGTVPPLSDFTDADDEYVQRLWVNRRTETGPFGGTYVAEDEVFVHGYREEGPQCWHWCSDGDERAIGPAETCPDKATHDD